MRVCAVNVKTFATRRGKAFYQPRGHVSCRAAEWTGSEKRRKLREQFAHPGLKGSVFHELDCRFAHFLQHLFWFFLQH